MSREHGLQPTHGPAAANAALLQRIDALTSAVMELARQQGTRLTNAEVCERLDIHRNTLRTYIETRGFPQRGRDGKWLLAEIVEWEAGH